MGNGTNLATVGATVTIGAIAVGTVDAGARVSMDSLPGTKAVNVGERVVGVDPVLGVRVPGGDATSPFSNIAVGFNVAPVLVGALDEATTVGSEEAPTTVGATVGAFVMLGSTVGSRVTPITVGVLESLRSTVGLLVASETIGALVVGATVGLLVVSEIVGLSVMTGAKVGFLVASGIVGILVVGTGVGLRVGSRVGRRVGSGVGDRVGDTVGLNVGAFVGAFVGTRVGEVVGRNVGALVGAFVGRKVGDFVGAFVTTASAGRLPVATVLPVHDRVQAYGMKPFSNVSRTVRLTASCSVLAVSSSIESGQKSIVVGSIPVILVNSVKAATYVPGGAGCELSPVYNCVNKVPSSVGMMPSSTRSLWIV